MGRNKKIMEKEVKKAWTVQEFQTRDRKEFERWRENEANEKGEADLHSADAVGRIRELDMIGSPVDDYNIPVVMPDEEKLEQVSEPQPPANGVPRILFAIPILAVTFDFFKSFLDFWQELTIAAQGKYEVGYHFIYRKPVHIAETTAVQAAQWNKCTHILLMDDDILDVKPWMLEELLKADKDVIAGCMYTSKFPYALCTFRRFHTETTVASQPIQKSIYRLYEVPCRCPHCAKEDKQTVFNTWAISHCPVCNKTIENFAVQPVDLIPFCFTLIKTPVFEKIRKPWFHCNTIFPTDSWFADRCIEAGIQQYAHMGIRLNHGGITDATRPHRFNEGLEVAKGLNAVCHLTKREMDMHCDMVERKMQVAEKKARNMESPKFLRKVDAAQATQSVNTVLPQIQGKIE